MNFSEPVYLYEDGAELPTEGNYYLIAANGIFYHKNCGIVNGLVKVDKIPFLKSAEPKVDLKLPKLPASIIARCLRFFRKVYDVYSSEAAVLLYYNTEKDHYYLHCPLQEVSFASVSYAPKKKGREQTNEVEFATSMRKMGYAKVGTIHSHCDFGAFHSGVDISDESYFDGIHVTIGDVKKVYFSVSASLVVNNNRFAVDPSEVILGLEPKSLPSSSRWMNYRSPGDWYDIVLTEEDEEVMESEEDDWMDNVVQKRYTFTQNWFGNYEGEIIS